MPRARNHYYYPLESYSPLPRRRPRAGAAVAPTVADYARIVRWLHEAVGADDPRGFDPAPLFAFACRYALVREPPDEIYRQYVAYQCSVFAEAGARLTSDVLNHASFADLQQWYEDERERDAISDWHWVAA